MFQFVVNFSLVSFTPWIPELVLRRKIEKLKKNVTLLTKCWIVFKGVVGIEKFSWKLDGILNQPSKMIDGLAEIGFSLEGAKVEITDCNSILSTNPIKLIFAVNNTSK